MQFELNTDVCSILNVSTYYTVLGELIITDDEIVSEAEPFIEEQVSRTPGFKLVSMGLYHRPRYYNYDDDDVSFTVEYDGEVGDLIEEYSNNEEFVKFLENYKSYDGFISYMADNREDFITQEPVRSIAQIIKFNADDLVDVTNKFYEEVYDKYDLVDDDSGFESLKEENSEIDATYFGNKQDDYFTEKGKKFIISAKKSNLVNYLDPMAGNIGGFSLDDLRANEENIRKFFELEPTYYIVSEDEVDENGNVTSGTQYWITDWDSYDGQEHLTLDDILSTNECLKEGLVHPSNELLDKVEQTFANEGFKLDDVHTDMVRTPKQVDTDWKQVHYQIVSTRNDNDEVDLELNFNSLMDKLEAIGDEYHSPITMSIGLMEDGTITAGVDVRAMSVKEETNISESLDVRPTEEQKENGLENGWSQKEVELGYAIFQDSPDDFKYIAKIDDMETFDTDYDAAEQARRDGIKFIELTKEEKEYLHSTFNTSPSVSDYNIIDDEDNRKVLNTMRTKMNSNNATEVENKTLESVSNESKENIKESTESASKEPKTLEINESRQVSDKIPAKVREFKDIIDANIDGYKLYPNKLVIKDGGTFSITTQVFKKLVELGYKYESNLRESFDSKTANNLVKELSMKFFDDGRYYDTFLSEDDELVSIKVLVEYGDLENDHNYVENSIEEFFNDKGINVTVDKEIKGDTQETSDDVFTAIYTITEN